MHDRGLIIITPADLLQFVARPFGRDRIVSPSWLHPIYFVEKRSWPTPRYRYSDVPPVEHPRNGTLGTCLCCDTEISREQFSSSTGERTRDSPRDAAIARLSRRARIRHIRSITRGHPLWHPLSLFLFSPFFLTSRNQNLTCKFGPTNEFFITFFLIPGYLIFLLFYRRNLIYLVLSFRAFVSTIY